MQRSIDHPSIAYLSRYGLKRHYSVGPGWDSPGFFVGDAANVDDLTCHWNLRAADIRLLFVDAIHIEPAASINPGWEKRVREIVC